MADAIELAHVRTIAQAVDVPVNAEFEGGLRRP
jgi:2-methylisocitrate lyase-like PEP mutase family enzyme